MNNKSITKKDILNIIDYSFGDLKNEEAQIVRNKLRTNEAMAAFERNTSEIVRKSPLNKSQITTLLLGDIRNVE